MARVDPGQHDLGMAGLDEQARLVEHHLRLEAPAGTPGEGHDTKGAAVLAAVLDFEKGARLAVDPRQRCHVERPRVGDVPNVDTLGDVALEQVGQPMLVRVTDDQIHLAEPGDVVRARLGPAAGHDEPRARTHPGRAPDRLAVGELGARSHRARVHHDHVGRLAEGHRPEAARLEHRLELPGVHLVEPAAERLDAPRTVDRHELRSDLVGRGVERDRQVHLEVLATELLDPGHEPHGRDGDPPRRVAEAELGVGEDPERLDERRVVGERLAHSHEDDVGHPLATVAEPVGGEDLAQDLGGGQVPLETHHTGQAEPTLEPAADLSGDTEGEAVVVGHEHRADPAPVAQTEDELSAAVLGGGDALGLRDVNGDPLGEPGADVLREITHRVEVENALAIDPRRELAPARPRRAQLDREIFELIRQETDEIHRLASPPAAARTATFTDSPPLPLPLPPPHSQTPPASRRRSPPPIYNPPPPPPPAPPPPITNPPPPPPPPPP